MKPGKNTDALGAPGGGDKVFSGVVPHERWSLAKGAKKTVMRPVAYA